MRTELFHETVDRDNPQQGQGADQQHEHLSGAQTALIPKLGVICGKHRDAVVEQPHYILTHNHAQSDQCTQTQQEIKQSVCGSACGHAEQILHDGHMPFGGNGQKLRSAPNQTKNNGVDNSHFKTSYTGSC